MMFRPSPQYTRDTRAQLRWMLPGLYIKRWLGSALVGVAFTMMGLALLLNLHPIAATIDFVQKTAPNIPSWQSGTVLLIVGSLLTLIGWRKTTNSVLDAVSSRDIRQGDILEALYRRNHLQQGPKIVAIGGGTGLSTLLRGLKVYTSNITAIVTVADDGGSSGRLRQEFGIIPPGDIRNCIAALADEEKLITALFQYRFKSGSGLEGHSFGNLLLSVMGDITGNMYSAIKESSKVLNIRGRVLPATLENVNLVATLENGKEVWGESQIPESGKQEGGRIVQLRCEPNAPKPVPEALEAIENAELIILGPGSLYTSVLPNLLIPEITDALDRSNAPKVYVCNVMTQPGETGQFRASDHVKVLLDHCPNRRVVDAILVNNWIPKSLADKYAEYASVPVEIDRDRIQALNIDVIERVLVDDGQVIRHNPKKLSRAIVIWFKRYQRQKNRNSMRKTSKARSESIALPSTQLTNSSETPPSNVTVIQ
jgi:uncharacterized cofD-like protein